MERLIFHIDVNSAFLSWESARRVSQGIPEKMWPLPVRNLLLSGKSLRAEASEIRESVLLVIWQGNGKQMYSSGLEKNQSTDEK